MKKTILVTGGAGFIGSNFIQNWVRKYDDVVINLDLLTYSGNPNNLASLDNDPRYNFVKGNIGDTSLVKSLLEKHMPYALINFAAESHVDRSIHNPGVFVETNVVGTCRLLEETLQFWKRLDDKKKNAFRFLHVSTDEVYGSLNADDPLFTEKKQYEPNSPYSASKASSDHFVRAYHHTYGLPILTTNCSNNYGPYQFPEKLIPLIITNALADKPLPIYGDGLNVRDWLFVGDHCNAINTVIKRGVVGETYNIGGMSEKTNLDIVHDVCNVLDEMVPAKDNSYKELIAFV
ncbi:MAG: dTDP-glucose 4,6-dehydratase, partial [Gammaproteobacteria bacterium]